MMRLAMLRETAAMLCLIAVVSAVSEVLLAGRKGETAVCFILGMAGVGTVATRVADLLG